MRVFVAILVLGILALLTATLGSPTPRLSVVNGTQRPVRALSAQVGSLSFPVGEVGAGDSLQVALPIRGAGPLSLQVEFEDGGRREVQAGYFAPGMRGASRLEIVAPDSVVFSHR